MQKTVILGIPTVYTIGQLIKENLEYSGFKVIDISFNYAGFKYKSFSQRAHNFYRKTFLRDKAFKNVLKFAKYEAGIIETLNNLEGMADYAFIIRPDTYSKKVLELVRKKTGKTVAYQWDGINRFPWIRESVAYFDRFFVFDKNDIKDNNSFLFTSNFYFDLPRFISTKPQPENAVFYLGSFVRNRMKALELIVHELNKLPIKKNIVLYSLRKKNPRTLENMRYTKNKISYEENIEMIKRASVLIDVPAKIHSGLSFRSFEALCFEKKLITSNRDIKAYDFYDPDNIFIMGVDDNRKLKAFVTSPYKKIDERIKQKYGFTNWIKYVLDIPPYLPIDPPTLKHS